MWRTDRRERRRWRARLCRAECGALCPPSDARAHGSAVVELLFDSLQRQKAGAAARARAEIYAWPEIRRQIREILT
jgi:hypothetical protein